MGNFFDCITNTGEDWEEESVDWDAAVCNEDIEETEIYEDSELYEEDIVYEDGEIYEEDIAYEDDEIYEDDVVYEDGEIYEDDVVYEDSEIYEDDVVYEDGVVYEDDMVYGDDVVYDDFYEEELYDEEKTKGGLFAWFGNSSIMDKVMLGAGACVILLLVVVGVVLLKNARSADYSEVFASVGTQLDGIEVVGDKGLSAIESAALGQSVEQPAQEQEKDYGEVEYNKNVTITLKTASVQKDLKIKFVNKNSDKLVANVPFSVTVTGPDGKSQTWSDDDMDGIIHKKSITPGTYKLLVNALSGDKYSDYAVPSATLTAEVKKDIAYQKVDVSDEVKTEAQVDVKKEEQIKQEPVVESVLQDTVEWVESTTVINTYIEVAKNEITDPMTSAKSGAFMRMSATTDVSGPDVPVVVPQLTISSAQSAITIDKGSSSGVQVTVSGAQAGTTVNYTASSANANIASATVDQNGKVTVTGVNPGSTTVTVTASGGSASNTPSVSIAVTVKEKASPTISLDKTSVTVDKGVAASVQISVGNTEAGKSLKYNVSSADANVATATVDQSGKVTITGANAGQTTISVTVNYTDNSMASPLTASIAVTTNAKTTVSLDKTTLTVYAGNASNINATVSSGASISAKSSDEGVATVKVDGNKVAITGVKAGTATITVTATKGNDSVSATCAVTVKNNPKNDTTTKLKDNAGNQLYVQENGNYREAVYADYYKDGVKFFKKGEAKYTGWQTLDGKVFYFDKSGKKVTGEQVIQGAKYNFDSDGVLNNGSAVMGIDVSKYNGNIDWEAVKNSGVSYVIIRCGYRGYTQGSIIIDSKFEQNIKGATNAGLKVGVYFYSQAVDEVEAVEEASFVLDAVKNYKISYPIFLDVEYSGAPGNSGRADKLSKAERTAVCKAFCETIRSGGYTAGVYANKSWLETMIDPNQLSAHKIWLAQYAATPTYKGRYDMWQYKSTGKISGISGDVDMNLSYMGY